MKIGVGNSRYKWVGNLVWGLIGEKKQARSLRTCKSHEKPLFQKRKIENNENFSLRRNMYKKFRKFPIVTPVKIGNLILRETFTLEKKTNFSSGEPVTPVKNPTKNYEFLNLKVEKQSLE